ncbi:nucleotidyl transferase AbiEii/AbiGii toxin family protein [bacterium]|nr:nucleotidyl transferase AbiEii/AbiGii toxin family protein [bacterium]
MEREIKNKAASVRAKLMNTALSLSVDFDTLLLRYFQERLLYRIFNSEYSDNFILKGGLFLICLNMPRSRSTKDIDFLAKKIPNDLGRIKEIFQQIADYHVNDGVEFISSSITVENLMSDAEYLVI